MSSALTVGNTHWHILGWREVTSELGNPWHQCKVSLAIVGDVWEIKKSAFPHGEDVGRFMWSARIMEHSRVGGVAPRGYAATLEAAKAIVECILVNTGTCDPRKTNTQDAHAANEAKIAALVKACEFATDSRLVVNISTGEKYYPVTPDEMSVIRQALALART